MTRRFRSTWLRASASSLALATGLLVLAHPAAAQTTATTQTADQNSSAPVVTISAERRTVNLQSAPVAATVIGGAKLQDIGLNSLDDLQFFTPSLTVADDGGTVLFNIRGLGKDLTNVQTPSGVVTYWDGVASFPGFFQIAPYYDIANVEVLRGPQGTFAGQNADAGALFITTNDPKLHSLSLDMEGQYGNYNDGLIRATLNVPLGDNWAARVAINTEDRSSFYHVSGPWTTTDNGTPGRVIERSGRFSLLWEPNSSFKAVFKADYNYLNSDGVPADPSQMIDLSSPSLEAPNNAPLFHVTNYTRSYGVEETYRLSLNAAYTFPNGIVLKSISSYQYGVGYGEVDLTIVGDGTGPFTNAPYPDTFADNGRETIYSEEINIISPDKGPFRWLGGLYYQHDYVTLLPGGGNTGFDIGLSSILPGLDADLHYKTPKVTEAAFGQVSYDLTPALQLQVGARVANETFGLTDTTFNQSFGGVVLPATILNFAAHTSNSGVTGKVALNWQLNANNFLYAFVATGSKAAGINTTPAAPQTVPAPFAPETVTDFEAGWKPTWFDGHVRAQFGVYYDQYQKFQLSFATQNTAAPTQSFIRNVGGTTTLYGFEAEVQAVFGPLSFDAGGSYEHSALGSAVVDDPGPSNVTPLFATPPGQIQLSGRVLPLAPEWTFNAGGQYIFTLMNGATLTPRVDVSYTASQWGTPYQDVGDFVPSHTLVNAEIAYAKDKYKVTLFATNAFNEQYLIGAAGGLRYAGAPAQYGIRLEGKF